MKLSKESQEIVKNGFIIVNLYGYWRDTNESKGFIVDREEMHREFNAKLDTLEREAERKS